MRGGFGVVVLVIEVDATGADGWYAKHVTVFNTVGFSHVP